MNCMKINKNYIQTLIFIGVYLFAIYYWSQPFQERKLPYGEYDAMSHFEVADYISYNDKSFMALPPYIDERYGNDNAFRQHVLWYPPTFHSALGYQETISGERILPVFLMNTVLVTFIVVTLYFVINSLFGFYPAILSAIMLIFSPRDFMPFLWGQWPERFGYAIIPIALYCLYKYLKTRREGNKKGIYLYLTGVFLGINLLVHPLSMFHSLASLGIMFVLFSVKKKKFLLNWKHLFVGCLIFLLIFLSFPLQTFNIFGQIGSKVEEQTKANVDLGRLFQWSLPPEDYVGSVPASYFSYNDMHGAWTLPFLLLGLLFLVIRRNDNDLLLIAWIVGLYTVLHRDLFGQISFLHRSLSATAHIFIPITALGGLSIASFVKFNKNIKIGVKFLIIGIFLFFIYTVNMADASKSLNNEVYNAYSESGFFTTLNHAEVEAADWILRNTPENFKVTIKGIPYQEQFVSATSKKIKWFAAISQRVTRFYFYLEDKNATLDNFYIVMDYTMVAPLQNQEPFASILAEMQEFEQNVLVDHKLLYNKDNIRIYKK